VFAIGAIKGGSSGSKTVPTAELHPSIGNLNHSRANDPRYLVHAPAEIP
jgi:hypothetical protein